LKIYQLDFIPGNNQSLSPRTEFVKCSDIKILQSMSNDLHKHQDSLYYGYKKIDIKLVKGIPAIYQIKI